MIRLAVLLCLVCSAVAADTVPEPDDYRMEAFRAPVPATLLGAPALDTLAAHRLWVAGEAVFVDVLPRPPKPAGLPADTLWFDKPRDSIPGAIWLPNTGYGKLPDDRAEYFAAGLATIPQGTAMVIFCQAECWMSWNAARRAVLEHGRSQVLWYPDGTDGWVAAGHPVEEVEPWAR